MELWIVFHDEGLSLRRYLYTPHKSDSMVIFEPSGKSAPSHLLATWQDCACSIGDVTFLPLRLNHSRMEYRFLEAASPGRRREGGDQGYHTADLGGS